MMIRKHFPSFVAMLSMTACTHNPLQINVSNISVKVQTLRFDQDLFRLLTPSAPQKSNGNQKLMTGGYLELKTKYAGFLPLFSANIMRFGVRSDSGQYAAFYEFVTNKDLLKLKHDVDSVYSSFTRQQEDFEDAFRHYRYYYPKAEIPQVVTFTSGFNNAVVVTDSLLGVGLDMFLGSRYRYYRSVNFPRYLIRSLNKDHLMPAAIAGFAKQVFPNMASSSILGQMIYEGKVLYFLDAMLPTVADSAKIAYSQKQLSWCLDHEAEIWAYLVEGEKLFSVDRHVIDPFFSEGPFTQGLSRESPSRLAYFAGRQIVRKYMRENSKVTLQQLMKIQNERTILDGSAYKP